MSSILDENVANLELGAFHAARLQAMRGLNPQSLIDSVLRPLLPINFASIYSSPTVNRLGFYYGGNLERKILYIDGVNSVLHASYLVEGYNNFTGPGGVNAFNTWLRANKDHAFATMTAAGIGDPEYLDFVGHSAGGALATVMMDTMVQLQSPLKRKLITFGAPRAVSTAAAQRLSGSPIARYMTPDDPIPLVPPRATESPALVASKPGLTVFRWGLYVHTQGGIVVWPNGTTTDDILPPNATMQNVLNLTNWLFAVHSEANNPHSLTQYYSMISYAASIRNTAAALVVDDAPREHSQQEDGAAITRAQRATVAAIHEAGAAQNAQPIVVPHNVLFRPVRIGRIWYVEFAGEIVITAPREDRARHIARAGNDFLRSLPKQALVDPTSMMEQFQAFFAASVEEASGFSPKIRVGL